MQLTKPDDDNEQSVCAPGHVAASQWRCSAQDGTAGPERADSTLKIALFITNTYVERVHLPELLLVADARFHLRHGALQAVRGVYERRSCRS